MKKQLLTKIYLDEHKFMNNLPDKVTIAIVLITVIFVFGLIFSVKSPERKVIDYPIIWKGEYSNVINSKKNKFYLDQNMEIKNI